MKTIELSVDYNESKGNVFLAIPGSSGAKYDVDPNNIAKDIGNAVERYINTYCMEENTNAK